MKYKSRGNQETLKQPKDYPAYFKLVGCNLKLSWILIVIDINKIIEIKNKSMERQSARD